MIFDGKEFAARIDEQVRAKVAALGRKPKLVTIYNSDDEASKVYTAVKRKKAESLGVEFVNYDKRMITDLPGLVRQANMDVSIDGLMIQLPLTDDRSFDLQLCYGIGANKDVDGLNPRSGVMPATARAVLAILSGRIFEGAKVLVVGDRGMVGKAVKQNLACDGMDRSDFSFEKLKNADVIISCTGQERIIRPEMVKPGIVAIDVGYPRGDFDVEIANSASFFTPVPGGVGPVTVAMLYANLLDLVS